MVKFDLGQCLTFAVGISTEDYGAYLLATLTQSLYAGQQSNKTLDSNGR